MYDFDGGIYSETIRELKRTHDTWRRYAAYLEEVRSVLPFQAVYGEIQHYLNLLPPPKIA